MRYLYLDTILSSELKGKLLDHHSKFDMYFNKSEICDNNVCVYHNFTLIFITNKQACTIEPKTKKDNRFGTIWSVEGSSTPIGARLGFYTVEALLLIPNSKT